MRLWKSWFLKGFSLALVATLSAELATQIDRTNWLRLPILDWGTYITLETIIMNALVVTLFVSFIVGCLAALLGFAFESTADRPSRGEHRGISS